MSWRSEVSEERPTFAPSVLVDEEMTVRFLGDGRKEETRKGEATVFAVTVIDAPEGATDMNDEPLEEGEDYDMMTSSSRLLYALKQFADDLDGQQAVIRGVGEKDSYDRTYSVEAP